MAVWLVVASTAVVHAGDLLQKGFEPSVDRGNVINVGNDKRSVWSYIFGWWIEFDFKKECLINGAVDSSITDSTACSAAGGKRQDLKPASSFLLSITKLLLRLTMILGVVMIIRNGIRFVAAMGEESERTSIAKTIGYIALGIVMSLLSVVIINLLQSITQSTITDEPTPIASADIYNATKSDHVEKHILMSYFPSTSV